MKPPECVLHDAEVRGLKRRLSELREVLNDLYKQQECCRVDMNGSTTVRLRNVSAALWGRWMKAIEEV